MGADRGVAEGRQAVAVLAALRARPLRFPFTSTPWRCWGHVLGGAVFGPLLLALLAALLLIGTGLSVVGVGLVVLLGVALAGIPVGALERHAAAAGGSRRPCPTRTALPGVGRRARLRTRLRERATWRELGYTALFALVLSVVDLAFTALLVFCGALVVSPLVVWALAPETVMLIPGRAVPGPAAALPATAVGLGGLLLCGYAGALLTMRPGPAGPVPARPPAGGPRSAGPRTHPLAGPPGRRLRGRTAGGSNAICTTAPSNSSSPSA